jgi:protein phosphatase
VTLAVADGMGGAVAGEIASATALNAALDATGTLPERIQAANDAVVMAGRSDPTLLGMGTTLTIAEIEAGGSTRIGHVGDSRAYLLRDSQIRLITTDHTVVQQLVDGGYLTPEQAARHPQRNIITRAIGMPGDVGAEEYEEHLRHGDRLLLCSDGLNALLNDEQIETGLRAGASPEEAVWSLIEAANAAGGVDNTTVVVVFVEE